MQEWAKKAAQILPDYQEKIIVLALSCGFNNTANINRVFKKYLGMTPSEYKKKLPDAHIIQSQIFKDFLEILVYIWILIVHIFPYLW